MAATHTPSILIVGSEAAARDFVRRSFECGSFRYICVCDTPEALAVAKRTPIDAALVDLATSEPDGGGRLVKGFRREVPDLPIILVSDGVGADTSAEAPRHGAFDWLRKPLTGRELCEALDRAVRLRSRAPRVRTAVTSCAGEMARRATALIDDCFDHDVESPEALDNWLQALYRDDPWIAGHSRRVMYFTVLIGTMLEIEAAALDEIARAALLHDIGRFAIPEGLMPDGGPLTASELLVRGYVEVGYQVATANSFLRPTAPTLLAMRERFDGSGYPLGLRGDEIPIGARIIAVADAFDALSSVREGDGAVARVSAELVRGAGSCFDPAVIRAWLQCLDNGLFEAVATAGGEGL